jgi:hypothetical protein
MAGQTRLEVVKKILGMGNLKRLNINLSHELISFFFAFSVKGSN